MLSLTAAAAVVWLDQTGTVAVRLVNDPWVTTVELVCFGGVGAVLMARRPDLPFGWLLGIGALADILLVGVGVPSVALAQAGSGGELPAWGVPVGVLQWVPTAVAGIVNTRFPSGSPSTTFDLWLDRSLRYGIVMAVLFTYLGDSVRRDTERSTGVASPARAVDGTWVTPVGNAAVALVPLVILLGALAGIGVIVRCFRATGIERRQLQWRAAGAAASLLIFPLTFTDALPPAAFVAAPLIFVTTLVVPVLRYQLWSGPPAPSRRKVGLLVSRRTVIEVHEEERRRLRRDLHDGLGPLVTGLRLNLDAAQGQLATDPAKAGEYLDNARRASAEVISGLRGLVLGLRPPALDELGLAGTLRAQLPAITAGSYVQLVLDIDRVRALPAAVEVAVHRTTTEAVTNVVRHSSARTCSVALSQEGPDVVLRVDDDGSVLRTWTAGVGLTSMRQRAVDLGGTFLASSGPDGFHVRATYPSGPA